MSPRETFVRLKQLKEFCSRQSAKIARDSVSFSDLKDFHKKIPARRVL